jgi:Uncharacterised protein family (UPF0158)
LRYFLQVIHDVKYLSEKRKMKKEEFEIGKDFHTATGKWRCTDIGNRVVVAIHLDQKDFRNYNGPPYSVPEIVFDEYDMEGCSLDPSEFKDKKEKITKSQLFNEIEDAMMFVSSSGYGEYSALLDKSTGKIYYQSAYGDLDELEEFPEDEYDPDIHIEIPHKNELDLGRNLVFEFVEEQLSNDFERVRNIFRKKGAYGRYKDLLEERGLLEKWYDFENERQTKAIREWCEENDIKLDG